MGPALGFPAGRRSVLPAGRRFFGLVRYFWSRSIFLVSFDFFGLVRFFWSRSIFLVSFDIFGLVRFFCRRRRRPTSFLIRLISNSASCDELEMSTLYIVLALVRFNKKMKPADRKRNGRRPKGPLFLFYCVPRIL